MKRWRKVTQGRIETIVEQETVPTVPGAWEEAAFTDSPGDEVSGGIASRPKRWIITTEAFWDRFTNNERADFVIKATINFAESQALQRASAKRQIRRDQIARDGVVNLKKAKNANFVQDMETDGIIAAGRAAIILTTPTTDDEIPA